MTPFSLRSLLLAAIVLSNCISWTASRHHYTHNVNGHRSRHRRQGAGLFLSASYVLPGGEGTGWGEWGEISPCSRTCGGGVASRKRICLQIGSDGVPQCTGGDTQYFSCETQDCPAGTRDFREQQCSEFDNEVFRDVKYRWVPYTQAPNPCELNCMPHGERFYYRHRTKVVDGTRCNDESFDVCVNGICQPVGCDMMLGSTAREDKCRECRGSGANCQTTTGVIDTEDLRKGYNDVLLIPDGATNIVIAERAPSRNYLALRARNGTYYLNGEYQIDFPRSLVIAGALWYYERSQQGFAAPDKLRCLGPTNEPLILALLLQDDNVGIEYEYSVPNERAPPKNKQYIWAHEEFTTCSAPCGGGYQTRNVSCRSREELELVDEALCDKDLKPPTNQSCNTDPCAAQWTPGPWGDCSKRCGKGGTRSRVVHCTQIISNGYPSIVGDKSCFDILGPKPELHQTCNENATCPIWFTGPWKPCDKLCDEGKQTRQVVCYQKNGSRKEILSEKECEDDKPPTEQSCTLQPCDGVDWVLTEWSGCDSCLSTVRTRSALCSTKAHKVVDDSFCSYHTTPVTQEPCDKTKLPPCDVQWYATQWSKCSVDCGKGIQTRKVFCGLFDGASVMKVDDSRCAGQPKYNESKDCEVPQDKCPSKWFAGPWTACSKKCGGGDQYRRVFCLRGGQPVVDCDENLVVYSEQSCNTQPCDEDELLSDKTSPPLDNDYDDCIEEESEYQEVGLESDGKSTVDGFKMFSDSPTEGSGITFTAEHESTFTDSDSSLSSEELLSTRTSLSTDFTDFSGSGSGEGTSTDDSMTTESDSTSNETMTDLTGSTESSSLATGITEKEKTESTLTEATDTSSSNDTSSTLDGTESTVSEETVASGSTEYEEISETNASGSTELGSVPTTVSEETKETETTESEGSTLSSESGSIDTSESSTVPGSEPTDLTSSPVTEETTKLDTTSEAGETSESESTVTTESGATEESITQTDYTSESLTTKTENTEVTESTATENTETSDSSSITTDTSSIETSETAETESTESTITTESDITETTEISSTITSDTTEISSTEATEAGSTETTEAGGSTESTETTETSSKASTETTETDIVTEITETDIVTETTVSGSTESTESTETDSTESTEITEIVTTEATETTEIGSTGITEIAVTGSTEATETTEIGSTGVTETTETGSTEATETAESESGSTGVTEATETGSTESTEITETGSTEATETTETGSTEATETTETGSTEATETTETGSTEATETTETGSTEATETSEIDRTETTESYTGSTESTLAEETGSTKTTEEGSTSEGFETSPESSTTEASSGVTRWDLSSTVEVYTTKKARICKPRSCALSDFGCCPDKKTPALGPFDDGCPKPQTCAESLYGCCPDGVSPAKDPMHEGCPVEPCAETLFGCCESDNKTAAEGNDQEGCPPPPPACLASKYGCCKDETEAKGPGKEGCPETSTTVTSSTIFEETTETIEGSTTTSGSTEAREGCIESEFGCCFDNETAATGPALQGCPCDTSQFGCCPDGVASAQGPSLEGCVKSCNTSAFGCCLDGKSPAHGPDYEGCCLLYPYGCCPDNYKPADGPHLEGCGCQYSRYGCCPDNVTFATGANNKGCGCQYAEHGCCPDRHTEATGPEFEGCMCHTYQFGCCPDGVTIARGPNGQGCYCQQSQFGCCGDDQTHAKGPNRQGCDCATSKHGCCLDGVTEATGPKFEGCTDKPLDRQAACSLKFERGPCRNYSVGWFYDTEYGGCSRFWYGGCEGNGNRFSSKEECEDTCVSPPPKAACRLPQIKGACLGYNERWYYDTTREMCSNFIYGGCLGNANNFESRELCQAQCEPERAIDQCSLTIERGSCAGNYLRWGYSKETRKCQQFVWGGCEGNSNRFSTEAACMLRCNPPGEPQLPELCTLPAATGDCYDYREKWYFDTKNQRCGLFYYGGCGGNENRFDSEPECVNRCIPPTTTLAPRVPTTATQPAPGSEFCFMEIDAGPCNQMESKWAYDYTRGKCVSFQYGGCGGNQNNFPTEEHCAYYCKPTQDICQLPMLSGPCDESLMRWFYGAASDSCSQFTYGGCNGNDNRFETREECENRCKSGPAPSVSTTTTTPKVQENLPAECAISPNLEQCSRETLGEVWYYDREASSCKAHENLDSGIECRITGAFYSQEACERSCGVFRNIDVCQYSMEPGPCRDYRPKYYYNKNTSRCEEFAYGGCFGGANRFSTEQECEQVCMTTIDPCTLPAEPGNCVGHMVMWYFHPERDQCYQFVFGGCGGNDNKFDSREACEGRCRKQAPVTVSSTTPTYVQTTRQPEPAEECRTPTSLAPCGSNETVFYFDEASRRCEAADIGGCGSSINQYRTEEECERRCGAFRGIDVCRAGLDPGPCRAAIPKFYFEAASGSCREFTYGGCQGGANRFSTMDECEDVCANAGPESPNACTPYTEECAALEGTCQYGMKIALTAEGCSRCECEESPQAVNCDAQRRACMDLKCYYGITRIASPDGCETCQCLDDPCSRSNCASTERCVVTSSQDPTTMEVLYSAHCESNEIVDCDAFVSECAQLQCPYGVQRTRVGRCERCACIREETNCSLLRHDCEQLECRYGFNRTMGDDGCERCMCLPSPCYAKQCREGERCIAMPFRDPITQETRYVSNCKTITKLGECPAPGEPAGISTKSTCRSECRDDADCRGVLKCCTRGCLQLCLPPAPPTTPLPSTTHTPDVPRAPEANTDASLSRPQVEAAEGGKATLRCYFHGNPPPKITWRFGEVTIDGDAGRYRLLSDGALEIISLFRNDSGVYICVAKNELGSAQQQVTLSVADPVSTPAAIAGPEGPLTGELGQPLVVRCQAYGYPTPTIYWYRGHGGAMVPYSNALYEARGQELQIWELTMDTLGEYECQAYNGQGSAATWRVTVQAHRPPGDSRRSPYLVEREVVVTPRAPYSTLPAPPTTTEKPYAVVPPYTVPVHTSLPATSVVTAGAQLSLPCEVDGFPDPEVRWTKDDAPLASGDRIWIAGARLTIEHAEVSDSGVYSCHASNVYSSHSSAVRVSVQEVSIPASCVDNPTFANCALIVQSRFCVHKYYSKFCCKSCVEAGQLDPRDVLMQADQSFRK